MTLHESIRKVLLEAGKPLTFQEVAYEINQEQLYIRKDNVPVPASQVEARASGYPDLFFIEKDEVFLHDFNLDKSIEEQIVTVTRTIVEEFYQSTSLNTDEIVIFFTDLLSIKPNSGTNNKALFDGISDFFQSYAPEISPSTDLKFRLLNEIIEIQKKAKNHSSFPRIVELICSAILTKANDSEESDLPEVVKLLLKENILKNNITTIDILDRKIPLYLLSILEPNLKYSICYDTLNRKNVLLLTKILNLAEFKFEILNENSNVKSELGICYPPFGVRNDNEPWSYEFECLFDQQQRLSKTSYQLLVTPTNSLFNGGKTKYGRDFLVNDNRISGIYTIPYNSNFNAIRTLALIEVDSSYEYGSSFIGDYREEKNYSKIVNSIVAKKAKVGESIIVNKEFLVENVRDWSPHRLITFSEFKSDSFQELVQLKDVVEVSRGKYLNRKALYSQGEVICITSKDLNSESIYFQKSESTLSIDTDEISEKAVKVKKGDILIALIGQALKPNIYEELEEAICDQNILVLRCGEKVIPEYLVQELASETSVKQIEAIRKQGFGIAQISTSDLLNIRINIPSIEEQRRILLELKEPVSKYNENKLDSDDFNFIATLKHTMKQPLTTLSEDFRVLQAFLIQKSEEGLFSVDDIIVPVFEGEDQSTLTKHSLSATIQRCQRMINDAHDHLNKAEQLLKIETIKPKFELLSIKSLLLGLEKDNPNIEFEFKGRDYDLNIDRYSFKIMMENFIENANKHGFDAMNNPKILFRTEIERDKFDLEYVRIQYLNNGEPLSSEITTDTFLRKNSKSKTSAGDGYGGHLINKIIQMHKGKVEIDALSTDKELDFNVCFNIYLPKN